MSRDRQKKERERFFLEYFLRRAEISAESIQESESPDFLLKISGRNVGIELTELTKSSDHRRISERAAESISERIVRQASAIYSESKGRPVHVSVGFYPGFDLRKVSRDATASEIANFVLGLKVSDWEIKQLIPETYPSELNKSVAFVHVLGVPSHEHSHWQSPRAGWVSTLTSEQIQAAVDVKAKKIEKYRSLVDEVWLLLVADRRKPSQMFGNQAGLNLVAINSPFARTYYHAYPDGEVVALCAAAQQFAAADTPSGRR